MKPERPLAVPAIDPDCRLLGAKQRNAARRAEERLMLCESETRGSALLTTRPSIIWWPMVMEWWSVCDLIPHAAFERAFARRRAQWSPDHMSLDDRALYDSLPAVMTIYRGQDADDVPGLSWTLERKVAEGFARGHRRLRHRSPCVLIADVGREDVAFCCTDRSEQEVVLWRRDAAFIVDVDHLPNEEAA